MRIYEELFILRADTPEEEIDQYVEQMKQVVATSGGTIEKADKWGVRRLAYRVDKRDEGFFVLLQFSAPPNTVKELERRMRVSDLVMKFITVRIDEKLKKIDKRRKEREKRAKRKPQITAPAAPAAAVPARPGEVVPGKPGAPGAPSAPEIAVPEAPETATPEAATPETATPETVSPEKES
jgi:small subunit ribosomal protein S6